MDFDAAWRDNALRRLLRVAVAPAAREQATETAVALLLWHLLLLRLSAAHGKRLRAGPFTGIFLALLHLLAELLCLLLICKAQSRQTASSPSIVQLKSVKEGPVLVPGPVLVYLLIPNDTTIRWGDIDQFYPKGVAHEVVRQHRSALQAGVGPSTAIRIGNV